MDRLLKVDELAEVLGIRRTRAYQIVASGEIPVLRLGRNIRISSIALEEWIRSRSELRSAPGSSR
jgi:excisionase family DNA binding protein